MIFFFSGILNFTAWNTQTDTHTGDTRDEALAVNSRVGWFRDFWLCLWIFGVVPLIMKQNPKKCCLADKQRFGLFHDFLIVPEKFSSRSLRLWPFSFSQLTNTHNHPFALLSTVVFLFYLFAAFLCFFRLCCFSSSHTASLEAITEKRCELSWTGDKTKLRCEKFLELEIFTVILFVSLRGRVERKNKKRWLQTSDSIEPQSIALRFLWFRKEKVQKMTAKSW